jgi:CubicO group peptidase (beta-lactamase class C family)
VVNGLPSLDAALASLAEKQVPGIAGLVYERDGRVARATAGVADVATDAAMTTDTIGLWFSMTKIVTATAAMMLVERGQLDLDAEVRTLLREFPEPARGGEQPRVRHLLNHSSGIGNPLPIRWVRRANQPAPDAHEFALALLRGKRLKRPPGEQAVYSNLGYIALGEVVAAAAGQPYVDFVRGQILAPLQLTRSGFSYADVPDDDVATGHHRRFSPMTPLFRLLLPRGIVAGAHGRWLRFNRFLVDGAAYGGLLGSTADAARFMSLHVNGGAVDGVRLLDPATVEAMQTVQARGRGIDVGFGWVRRGRDRDRTDHWEHLGGGGGFWNMMRINPARRRGVVAMGNCTRYDHEAVAAAALRRTAP